MSKDMLPFADFERRMDEYAPILRFAAENNHIEYGKFDDCTVHRVNLFALRENYDFEGLEEAVDHIVKALPAIKRILARPITHIIDEDEILPVESVKVINNRTIVHAAVHSDLWSEITRDGIKPRKLLTRKHDDSYVTYENIGTTKAVRIIMSLVRHNIRILQDILYANRDLKFNLFERENHLSYFLAIGKLHIGYVRDYDKYYLSAERQMDKLLFIQRVLSARLTCPVYQKCKDKCDKFTLKKSTVFRVHKDYHQVYLLLKWFSEQKIEDKEDDSETPPVENEGYSVYCTLLSLFAAGHFNFTFDEKQPFDFFRLQADAVYQKWRLRIENVKCGEHSGILFSFFKDAHYKILLITSSSPKEERKKTALRFKQSYSANEYLFADPASDEGSRVHISLFDIESFRRIQQLLLRGMIYSDGTRDVCPFCGGTLQAAENDENVKHTHICENCRTKILYLVCPTTANPYFATLIDHYSLTLNTDPLDGKKERFLYQKQIEGQLFYRNITSLDQSGDIICPRCHKVHPLQS